MTRKDAANRLKIGVRTLDRRLATGDIKCYRLGEGPRAPVRISEEQISEYLRKSWAENDDVQGQLCRLLDR